LPYAARQAGRGPAGHLLEANQTLAKKLGPPPYRGAETLDNVRWAPAFGFVVRALTELCREPQPNGTLEYQDRDNSARHLVAIAGKLYRLLFSCSVSPSWYIVDLRLENAEFSEVCSRAYHRSVVKELDNLIVSLHKAEHDSTAD
jgi:hypothetical protein